MDNRRPHHQPDGTPGVKIVASDVYEWLPGGFFVVHPAAALATSEPAASKSLVTIPARRKYQVHFYDSQGNISQHDLTPQGRTWTWQGEHTCCTGVFSEDGKTQTAHHERTDDGVNWIASMDVTLRKVEWTRRLPKAAPIEMGRATRSEVECEEP